MNALTIAPAIHTMSATTMVTTPSSASGTRSFPSTDVIDMEAMTPMKGMVGRSTMKSAAASSGTTSRMTQVALPKPPGSRLNILITRLTCSPGSTRS